MEVFSARFLSNSFELCDSLELGNSLELDNSLELGNSLVGPGSRMHSPPQSFPAVC